MRNPEAEGTFWMMMLFLAPLLFGILLSFAAFLVGVIVFMRIIGTKLRNRRERVSQSGAQPPPLPPGYEESFRSAGPDHDDSIPTCTLL